MIIELDCGNTSIKWRFLTAGNAAPTSSGSVAELNDLHAMLDQVVGECLFCRVCSVRGENFDRQLSEIIFTRLGLQASFARSTKELAGVVNGYSEPSSLGVDRWLALVAINSLHKNDCLVIDCGTAITADYITSAGKHLGGVIAPGLKLLHSALYKNTCLPHVSGADKITLADNTEQAIKAGIYSMYMGFVQQQLNCAEQNFGSEFELVLTGGNADLVRQEFAQAIVHIDLVFVGLAIACPYRELPNNA